MFGEEDYEFVVVLLVFNIMEKIKYYLEQFKSERLSSADLLIRLGNISELTPEEKNLIYLYLYPRPLADKELPKRFTNLRLGENKYGSLTPSLNEATLIIEAGRTLQYSRYIKHLLHSYSNVENIHSIEGSNVCNCCLCNKEIYELTLWKSFSKQYKPEEENEKLFLAYGSLESDLPICMPCLLNLRKSLDILNYIDPGFLDWKLRK